MIGTTHYVQLPGVNNRVQLEHLDFLFDWDAIIKNVPEGFLMTEKVLNTFK